MFKIYYQLKGGHVHCRVFHNGLAGTLVFSEAEWPEVHRWLSVIANVRAEDVDTVPTVGGVVRMVMPRWNT